MLESNSSYSFSLNFYWKKLQDMRAALHLETDSAKEKRMFLQGATVKAIAVDYA